MKTHLLAGMATLVLTFFGVGPVENVADALWEGPAGQVEWVGLIEPLAAPVGANGAPAEMLPEDYAPTWVGYFNRSDDWFVRLRLFGSQEVETKRINTTTSDGWKLIDLSARGNRLKSVTVEKEGTSVTLELKK